MTTQAPFRTTRWSLVLAARQAPGSDAKRALGELCVLYWKPVYCYLRRIGNDPDSAMDLTQGFIASLLEKGGVGTPEQERGRFRTYLLAALNHFVADVRRRDGAAKRGGGVPVLPLEVDAVERALALEPVDAMTPEKSYRRQWALALMEDSLAALRRRYEKEGRGALFERLHPQIARGEEAERHAEAAAVLGMTVDAVKMAVSRMRKRYREELRARVAETVADPAEIDDELRGLIESLG
ncbi:hypothetical protein GC173_05920 [bacterium]|nr:hypothetical protein [bacterium]